MDFHLSTPQSFPLHGLKTFFGTYIQRNKFDDTVLFLVTTSVQWSEVVHGPLCLLRCSLKTTAIEILCRMTVEKEKGMTNYTSCFFFFKQAGKKPRKQKVENFRC